jgi:hypothetical protein
LSKSVRTVGSSGKRLYKEQDMYYTEYIRYDSRLTEEVEAHNLLCPKIGKYLAFERVLSLVPVPVIVLTLFYTLKTLLLYEVFPQNIKP